MQKETITLISEFLKNYDLANLVSFYDYIENIKYKVQSGLKKTELDRFITESKLKLEDDFKSNLDMTIKKMNLDLEIQISNPLIKGEKLELIEFMKIFSIDSMNKSILELFDKEVKKIIS